ncbi:hypothetical protein LTR56_025154 [Elasticomyces elasticus]|nr:hypothetical protein LTR56_025154 [Elasticomyces elasticus]KAK3623910.1 hypothetical protein LTR22_024185 [Elasticomyces elasticus]
MTEAATLKCYEIRDAGSKGVGLFATQKARAGTLILSELPIITFDKHRDNVKSEEISAAVAGLSYVDKQRWVQLRTPVDIPNRAMHSSCKDNHTSLSWPASMLGQVREMSRERQASMLRKRSTFRRPHESSLKQASTQTHPRPYANLTRISYVNNDRQAIDKQAVFVLSGMAGVGKSDTVLQFLERHDRALSQRYAVRKALLDMVLTSQQALGVFWVDCGTEVTARAGFKTISNRSGWPLDEGDSLYGARDHLSSCGRPVLLVLDNCDDARTDYRRYVPNGSQVTVILTTRLSDARRYPSPDPRDSTSKLITRMEGLDHDAAVDLLLEASEVQDRGQQTSKEARDLATALDRHPLTILSRAH